jgi:hypothetical protein
MACFLVTIRRTLHAIPEDRDNAVAVNAGDARQMTVNTHFEADAQNDFVNNIPLTSEP